MLTHLNVNPFHYTLIQEYLGLKLGDLRPILTKNPKKDETITAAYPAEYEGHTNVQ